MQTYTHYLITAVFDRKLRRPDVQATPAAQRLPPLRSFWFLLGGVAPDVPLIAITLFYAGVDLAQGCLGGAQGEAAARCMQPNGQVGSHVGYLFNTLFFHASWVKAAHNLFHAPLMVLLYVALGYAAWRWERKGWGAALFWFGAACLLHTAIDIPLHYDDGPLLLFPLEWETRFHSPISYWDPRRYGNYFAVFEHLLALGLLIYLLVDWRRGRRSRAD